MRKRNLIATAAVLVLSIQAGFATNISGVTGVNGVYDINPTQISGDKGFRHYENFRLSENDIANLIMKSGAKDLNTFINMVDNKVSIYGILNTVRNGEFANGHAVFISPNGMIVGESGVLNVGSLSVLTPTQNKYNNLLTDGAKMDLNSIKNEANADILIRGKILSRGNVNIQGADVALPETSVILNGVSDNSLIKSQEDVNTVLFNNLVNTSNLRAADNLTSEAGKIVIRANSTDKMLNVRGTVANYNSGNIELINNGGAGGLKVSGTIANADGNLELLNDTGKTLLKGSLENDGGFILISDKGDGVHLNSGSNVIAHTGSIKIENDGTNGLSVYGDIKGLDGDVSLENNTGKLYISGNVDYEGDGNFQIINNAEDTQLMIAKSGKINSTNDAFIKNSGKNGLFVNGTVNADNSLVLDNTSGDLTVNNAVTAGNGLSLQNSGNKLAISSKGSVTNDAGNLVIKNSGENGMLIYGNVENDGDVISIKNTAGDLNISSNVTAKSGDLGIVNEGNRLYLKENSVITNNEGETNIINDGENGLYVLGKFTSNGDDVLIQNDNGKLYISGNVDYRGKGKLQVINNAQNSQLMIAKTAQVNSLNDAMIKNSGSDGLFVNGTVNADNSLVLNNTNGDLTVNNAITAGNGLSLQNSGNKLAISSKGSVTNDAGNLVIKNSGENGMLIYGNVENDGDVISIKNTAGDLNISSNVTAKSGDLGIVNEGGNILYIKNNAVVSTEDGKTNIVNDGENGLYVLGKFTSDGDDVLIQNDNGKLYISGNVDYQGTGKLQITNNAEDTQLMIAKNGRINSINDAMIKNNGDGGLFVNGTVNADNSLVLNNTKGDLTVNNAVTAGNGLSLQNSGNKLSVSSKGSVINDAGNLVLRNTGANGSVIYGTVENDGDTISITNTAGDLNINGNITAKSGNLGIINDGNRLYLKDNSVITNNEGETNIVNNGAGGLKAVGTVNVGEKILNLHNNAGQGYIDGNVTSNGGNISILSKDDSKGIYIRKNANITNIPEIGTDLAGNIVIKDSASAAGNGLIIKGTVKSGNNVAASSENNNVYIGGTVNAKNDIKFSQSALNGTMTFNGDAKLTAGGKVTTEVTNGSKIRDMRPKN